MRRLGDRKVQRLVDSILNPYCFQPFVFHKNNIWWKKNWIWNVFYTHFNFVERLLVSWSDFCFKNSIFAIANWCTPSLNPFTQLGICACMQHKSEMDWIMSSVVNCIITETKHTPKLKELNFNNIQLRYKYLKLMQYTSPIEALPVDTKNIQLGLQ